MARNSYTISILMCLVLIAGCAGMIHEMHGTKSLKKGQDDAAIADLTRAIAANPGNARAYGNRGIAYSHKGLFDQAIADQSAAIRLSPNDPRHYVNRGVC